MTGLLLLALILLLPVAALLYGRFHAVRKWMADYDGEWEGS